MFALIKKVKMMALNQRRVIWNRLADTLRKSSGASQTSLGIAHDYRTITKLQNPEPVLRNPVVFGLMNTNFV